jgi:transposase-like protein
MTSKLNSPDLQSEEAAREMMERIRWPNGPVCHHCDSPKHYATKRAGVYRCANAECRKDFTVMTGSVMERSHIPLHKWLQAYYLLCSSKKGISSKQIERTLGISYKAAWFLTHRIREAMRAGGLVPPPALGGEGKIVEADETYFGQKDNPTMGRQRKGRPYIKGGKAAGKRSIVSLVERGGSVRTFHVAVADKVTVTQIVRENIARESRLHTDESRLYFGSDEHFATHETVTHFRKEYVRGDIHTNTAEGYFSILKRGMRGIYQHCREKHLHRYLAEYDFRYNTREKLGFNDMERTEVAIKGAEGKRLTYRQPH